MKFKNLIVIVLALISLSSCGQTNKKQKKDMTNENVKTEGLAEAVLGAGCFWCVEAVFQRLNGVAKVESGYTGGTVKNPSYKDVCTGLTGHAEVCKIYYDPIKVKYEEILEVFFKTHDPTTLNRQGNDVGTQYRSAIFYKDANEKAIAEKIIADLNVSGAYDAKIVTTLEPLKEYYVAEDYHQNYFNQNGSQPYCAFVVKPKVEKFEKVFKDRVKKN